MNTEFVTNENAIAVLQVNRKKVNKEERFACYDLLRSKGKTPDPDNYEILYQKKVDFSQIKDIDHYLTEFDQERLFVGDIVAIKRIGIISYYFVDYFNYKKLDNFNMEELSKSPLKPEEFYIVITHNFDPETRIVKFNDYDMAKAYLHWSWEKYYNEEIANGSSLCKNKCWHDDEEAIVTWEDGTWTNFILTGNAYLPENDFLQSNWKKYL